MRDRSFRRHQEEKSKRKTRDKLANGWNWTSANGKEELDAKTVGILSTTPHTCSDACCGNPRHHFSGKYRLTMQERKQDEKDKFDG